MTALTFAHVQQRDGRWCIVDLVGKHGRVRTMPMPNWVKARSTPGQALGPHWFRRANITWRPGQAQRANCGNRSRAGGRGVRAIMTRIYSYAEGHGLWEEGKRSPSSRAKLTSPARKIWNTEEPRVHRVRRMRCLIMVALVQQLHCRAARRLQSPPPAVLRRSGMYWVSPSQEVCAGGSIFQPSNSRGRSFLTSLQR